CVNRARETRSVDAHDYSSLTICFRYLAGALGISFIPVKSLIASEILERLEAGSAAKDLQRMKCPFTGEDYLLLRSLNPDVSFVHVKFQAPEGKGRFKEPGWKMRKQAKQ